MGPAVDAGKLTFWAGSPAYPDVIDTSVLFGDPATRLRLPPAAPSAAAATSPEGVLTIRWQSDARYTAYQVWRATRPYFSPDDVDAVPIGNVTAPFATEVIFTDTADSSAIGNPDLNYFYAVRGVGATADSDPVGEFDFALTPGN